MSLFGSLQIARNALLAAEVGLQVTGNNISNANTPGYIRQRVIYTPAPTQVFGDLPLGLGVQVDGIVQATDKFLNQRVRAAVSDLAGSETQEQTYLQLEALIGELGESDLSTSLSNFFSSIHDVLNQPEDVSVRNLVVQQGRTLTADIRRLDGRVRDVRENINDTIVATADDINRLLQQIAELNVGIVQIEAGGSSNSDAVGLRDQREVALTELSKLVAIQVNEQTNGSVSISSGGDFLVHEGITRAITVTYADDRGLSTAALNIEATDAPLTASAGKLAGLYAARDEVLGGFLDQLGGLTASLVFEFNKIYSSGQGLTGLTELTGEFAVTDADAALDQAGLDFTPVNGSLQLLVHNTRTGITETNDLFVRLNGLDDDTTLADLAAQLDAIDGISASVTPQRRLSIGADSSLLEFSFAHDTSGVLAALGVHTFFTGADATDIGISEIVRNDPSQFAASQTGIGEDVENALQLASFGDRPLDSQDGDSLVRTYEKMIADVAQASSVTKAVSEGFRVFHSTLESQQMALSGVSIDEEAVQMIALQRAYQASARLIGTVSELLNILMNI